MNHRHVFLTLTVLALALTTTVAFAQTSRRDRENFDLSIHVRAAVELDVEAGVVAQRNQRIDRVSLTVALVVAPEEIADDRGRTGRRGSWRWRRRR